MAILSRIERVLFAMPLAAAAAGALAATPAVAVPAPGQVVVSGTVPDEATRQSVLTKARAVFGVDRVVDQLGVGNLIAPANWSNYLQGVITPDLKQVNHGQISISGNVIDIKGEVGNEAVRQQIVSEMSTRLNKTYTVRNGLRVVAAGQDQIDLAMASRTIEFEPGNSSLTASGRQTLELLAPLLLRLGGRSFEVTGHTDGVGSRPQNIALSAARADAVKTFLVGKGIAADKISTSGAGPDRPLAANDTPDGRARNRRIELRVVQ
ncbi:MAG: OmpA family protein [Caldimonas sp.]